MASSKGGSGSVEFLPGIVLPPLTHGMLRKHLTEILVSNRIQDCVLAQAQAECVIQALEAAGAMPSSAIDRLTALIQQSAKIRLADLGQQ